MNRAILRVVSSGVSIGAAALAAPGMALAATPEGTTGGSGIVAGPDPTSVILEIVTKVAAIAIGLAILVGLGYGVARIGGRRVATEATDGVRSGARLSRAAIGVVGAVALVIGVLAGWEIAHAHNVGGFGGLIGAAIVSFFVVAAVVGLVLVGLIATKFRHGQVSSAIASVLAAAALLAVGTIGGGAAASAFGGI